MSDIITDLRRCVAHCLGDTLGGRTALVTEELLTALAEHNIGVYRQTGPKVREGKAIAEAKDKLAHSINVLGTVGGQASSAVALQGILVMLIEMQERQWDAPCDCFAGEPLVDFKSD